MRIVFIGGTTGAGKSSIGRVLAAEADALYIEGDALRVRLQQESAQSDPVNVFRVRPPSIYLSEPVVALCAAQARVSAETCERAFAPALDAALRDSDHSAVLLEGDDVLPDFVAEWRKRADVRAVFAVEVGRSMPFARSKAPGGLSPEQVDTFVAVHRCRGDEIAADAMANSMAVVTPRDEDAWRRALALTG